MNKSDLKDGMIVTLRKGIDRVIIKGGLFSEYGATCTLDYYNDDLTHTINGASDDIVKIEYGGEVIWERKVEWDKVPFGTKVRGWNEGDTTTNVGKFLAYDDNDTAPPFFIFLEQNMQARWFRHCELLVEEDE